MRASVGRCEGHRLVIVLAVEQRPVSRFNSLEDSAQDRPDGLGHAQKAQVRGMNTINGGLAIVAQRMVGRDVVCQGSDSVGRYSQKDWFRACPPTD